MYETREPQSNVEVEVDNAWSVYDVSPAACCKNHPGTGRDLQPSFHISLAASFSSFSDKIMFKGCQTQFAHHLEVAGTAAAQVRLWQP